MEGATLRPEPPKPSNTFSYLMLATSAMGIDQNARQARHVTYLAPDTAAYICVGRPCWSSGQACSMAPTRLAFCFLRRGSVQSSLMLSRQTSMSSHMDDQPPGALAGTNSMVSIQGNAQLDTISLDRCVGSHSNEPRNVTSQGAC